MGHGKLALFLVFVFCATALLELPAQTALSVDVLWLEVVLMALSLVLLLAPQPPRDA
jgi:hypothetical protein